MVKHTYFEMKLVLINQLSREKYEFDVQDTTIYRNYYDFQIELPEGIQDGQYVLSLYNDDNELLYSDIAQVGDYVGDNQTYSGNNNDNRIVYNG